MHSKLLTGLFSAALISVAAAQNAPANATSGVVTPTVPTPAVAPAAPVAPAPTTSVTQVVHTPTLPTAADLQNAAAQQGLKLERVVQTPTQVIAFYRNAEGQESTVAYQTLPPQGTPAPAPVVTTARTVVYETPRVIYYDDYPYYGYPRVWYPPVSLSLGFGFGHGYRGYGGYGGGFRHWR